MTKAKQTTSKNNGRYEIKPVKPVKPEVLDDKKFRTTAEIAMIDFERLNKISMISRLGFKGRYQQVLRKVLPLALTNKAMLLELGLNDAEIKLIKEMV